jgi:hypothetical protein
MRRKFLILKHDPDPASDEGQPELIKTLNSKIELLESIENYLQDWLWGLTYQFIRHGEDEASYKMQDGLQ